jgi:hypothetical protein
MDRVMHALAPKQRSHTQKENLEEAVMMQQHQQFLSSKISRLLAK